MELIADILLVAGALGAGLYCFVLARRLKRFTDLEKGVGGAVSVLSAQADELRNSLDLARAASDRSGEDLQNLTQRAESVAQRLELMMASMHDMVPQETVAPEVDEPAAPDQAVSPEAPTPEDETELTDEADSQEEAEKQPAVAPSKAPDGVMFIRHSRPNGGAVT